MNPVNFFASQTEFRNAIDFSAQKDDQPRCLKKYNKSTCYEDCGKYEHTILGAFKDSKRSITTLTISHTIEDVHCSKKYHPYGFPWHDITSRVDELFETIRRHIEYAAKNYQISVTIPILKGKTVLNYEKSMYCTTKFPYTALLAPSPEEQVTQDDFDRRGVVPCVVNTFVFPLIKDLLLPHGFKTELHGEALLRTKAEKPTSYFIATGITVSWTKQLNPFVIFPQPPAVLAPKAIGQTLWTAYKLEQHTDLVFVCTDKKEIRAHSLILKLASPYFERALKYDYREKREGRFEVVVTSSTLTAVLDHVYSGKNPFDSEEGNHLDSKELIHLANQWDLVTLRNYAANFIGQTHKEEEWMQLKELALAYQSLYLLELYKYYSLRFAKEPVHDPEIEALEKQLQNAEIDP